MDVEMNGAMKQLKLRARIERNVMLEASSIELGGRSINWLKVVDPDRLLEAALIRQDKRADELDPFWAATWRAARGLDQYLARLDLRQVRLLEIGCGSGQAGIGAAMRGAQVTLTDAVGLALLVARINSLHVTKQVTFRRLRWDCDTLVVKYPIVIGSDIVYDPRLFPLIDACARRHLTQGGHLYISEPRRHTGDHFAKWIVQAGWQTCETDIHLDAGRVPIRIFDCWLPNANSAP